MSDEFSEFGALNRIGDRLAQLEASGGPSRRPGWPKWLGGALAIGLVGVALSPAGAEVREVVGLENEGDRDCLAPALTQMGAIAETGDGLPTRRAILQAATAAPEPEECAEVMTLKEIVIGQEQRIEDLGKPKVPYATAVLRRLHDQAIRRGAQLEAIDELSPRTLKQLEPTPPGDGAP